MLFLLIQKVIRSVIRSVGGNALQSTLCVTVIRLHSSVTQYCNALLLITSVIALQLQILKKYCVTCITAICISEGEKTTNVHVFA